jgi:hypothetical protein
MKSIEEMGYSISLYNKFKRAGINFTQDIKKYDYKKLTKIELIELLEEHANYED